LSKGCLSLELRTKLEEKGRPSTSSGPTDLGDKVDFEALLSRRVRDSETAHHGLRRIGAPDMVVFGGGLPDPAVQPAGDIARLIAEIVASEPQVLGYGYEAGDMRLREIIAEGHGIAAEQVMLTNGSAGGIALAAAALIEPGDAVVVEAATYPGALKAFRQMGAAIVPAPMDAQGLDPDGLADVLQNDPRTKLIYTIATCHNPTATILSAERRRSVLDLAARQGALVMQDDTYGGIVFGAPVPDFIALDPDRSIHLGSFSKTIAPGLRCGWIAAPSAIAAGIAQVRLDLGTPLMLQRCVARFVDEGRFAPHVAAITAHYRRKRDAMLAGLRRHCRNTAGWAEPEGGFFVWLAMKSGDVAALLDAGESEGVSFMPGSYFAAAPGAFDRHIRLSYGEIAEDRIDEGLARLGRALSAVSRSAR
jgi:2-aminoadipate transaminase